MRCGVMDELRAELGATGVSADTDIARVSVIGAGMKSNPGVAATMFETLADNGINIEMISTSAIRISCVVAQDDAERAVQVLHATFELDKGRPTEVGLDPIGCLRWAATRTVEGCPASPRCSNVTSACSARPARSVA